MNQPKSKLALFPAKTSFGRGGRSCGLYGNEFQQLFDARCLPEPVSINAQRSRSWILIGEQLPT